MQDISERAVAFTRAKTAGGEIVALAESRLNVAFLKRAPCLVNEYLTFHVPRATPLGTGRGREAGRFVTVVQWQRSRTCLDVKEVQKKISGHSFDFEV